MGIADPNTWIDAGAPVVLLLVIGLLIWETKRHHDDRKVWLEQIYSSNDRYASLAESVMELSQGYQSTVDRNTHAIEEAAKSQSVALAALREGLQIDERIACMERVMTQLVVATGEEGARVGTRDRSGA